MLDREFVEYNLSALCQLLETPTYEVANTPLTKPCSVPSPDTRRESSSATSLLAALHSRERVSGLTHLFYRYPARFSPQFARAVIETFSLPGDLVLDPFAGGGTSGVEAVSAGRSFIGVDLNPLACFVTRTKTIALRDSRIKLVEKWAGTAGARFNPNNGDQTPPGWEEYTRNIPWRLRRACAHLLASLRSLPPGAVEQFARCSILSAMQKALDCRTETPSVEQFLASHAETVKSMCAGMRELNQARARFEASHKTCVIQADAATLTSVFKKRGSLPFRVECDSPFTHDRPEQTVRKAGASGARQ